MEARGPLNRYIVAEIDILNGIEKLDAVFHGLLECLAAGNESGAAGTLVDHGSFNGLSQIVFSQELADWEHSEVIANKVRFCAAGEGLWHAHPLHQFKTF